MPTTPLADAHRELGARFTDFGGWSMPLQYEGVLAEHNAVRTGAGVFDVTHLGRFSVSGPGSTELLLHQLCNNITKIQSGTAQYTMALNKRGGVEDDIIVWQFEPDEFWVMPNGVNSDEIIGRFVNAANDRVAIESVRGETVLLAVQGPAALDMVASCLGVAPGRFKVQLAEYGGEGCAVAGTGYTGEAGAEIAVPPGQADSLFRHLLKRGATPCGLGARDTLRLEMGYPLWGQDLDAATTPLEAGLGWVVDWNHAFIGREALEVQRDSGLHKRLVSFDTGSRRVPRHGYALRSGASVGEVTSGNFSPELGRGIGMGYLSPPIGPQAPLELEVRGDWLMVNRVTLPFIAK